MAEVSSQSASRQMLDQLRGELPAHEMGVTLAALIYLRWADFQEAEQEAIAAFEDADYKPVLPLFLHWRSWHALHPQERQRLFADQLPHALERLNNSRHNSMATHLQRIATAVNDLGRLSPRSLDVLIRWLAAQPFETPSDRRSLLDIFDSILDKAPDKYSGEFRTPAGVARLLVELAAPVTGDRIYDPCFGSAGLLTAAYDHVLRQQKGHVSRSGAPLLTICGIERNSSAYVIGLTRLALAGIGDPQLELGNSLERMPSDNPQRDGFDVVLCNPPWGMRTDPAGLDHYVVRTTDATGLFIQHALSQLRPAGRAVIVVPQGFLFRGGLEQRLRRLLMEQHTIEGVVALPETGFMPYTAVRANIIVLRRGGSTTWVRMVDAEPFFEKGKGRQPTTIRIDLAEELGQKLRVAEPAKYCWDVDAESLAAADWDFTPRRRDQSGLLGILDSLRPKLIVEPLKECCHILTGRPFKGHQLLDAPPPRPATPEQASLFLEERTRIKQGSLYNNAPHIPYVRIKDIKSGKADKGSSWLSEDAAASVDARWKLRAGDVLLSKSGTIGKAGIVRNGAVGAIAANGLYVLRPNQDRLDPHFLLAYLESSECRASLADKARGATIQHLSRQVIDELPVPMPPLQVQQRVAAEHREHGVDALAFLAQLLTGGDKDYVAEWVEKILEVLPTDTDAISDPLDLSLLDRLATEVGPRRNKAAHDRHGESPLVAWIIQFNDAVSSLRGIGSVPRGPGLLSVLQESASHLKDAIHTVPGHLPNEAKARNLSVLIAGWLDMACSALLNNVKLVLSTDAGTIPAGEMVEITLQGHNQAPLPLRDLRVTTTPDWGSGKFDYLAENSKAVINLAGAGPKVAGNFTLLVRWSGSTLDGQRVNGSREIAFDVIEGASDFHGSEVEIGSSPYVCGDPVRPDRNEVFFGRDELLDQIRRQIIQSGNVVLLEGNRRSGKSSILWHLEGPNVVPRWMGIYCSLQGAAGSREGVGVPTAEVFREIASSIAKSLHTLGGDTPLPDGTMLREKKLGIARACHSGIKETSAFSDLRDYVEVALEKLGEHNLGLLLMLDEFDKLQEGIDSGVTSPQVPENIRFLVQTYPRFSAILTGSRRLKRLREEYWSALFGIGTRFGVTSLPADAARRLVTEPVKGRLIYSQEAVERALSLTAGQPYLLQCLCNRIFDLAAQLKAQSVSLDLVKQAGNTLVEDNEHFAGLWDYAMSHRRRFILALCHREVGGPDPFRLGVIQEKLAAHGVEVDDETLIADLEFLRDLELIELVGEFSGGYYVLAIPLMGLWIERQQDFAALRSKARSETEDQNG